MSKVSRILPSILLAGIFILVTFTFSRVLAHFKNVIDSPNLYAIGQDLLQDHKPTLNWLSDDPDIKGEMNKYLRKEIAQAYSDAWGILNLSLKEKKDLGLSENFTEAQIPKIISSFSSLHIIDRTDLHHDLQLHFVSLDKKIISFTDRKCVIETKIKNSSSEIITQDTSEYKIVMTLDDGKWRVNKFIRI